MSDYPWNETTIARLREDWAVGFPTEEIGRRLGCSKNAILGKVHRLDLPGRQSPIRRDASPDHTPRRAIPKRAPKTTLPPMVKEVPLTKPPREPAVKLTCQWIEGDNRKTRKFCGAAVKRKEEDRPQSAYCAVHHARCWQRPYARAAA